jgi:hypothetical protein
MSTYLELVQDLHHRVGAAGTAPTGVTGLTGEAERLSIWIKQADNFVQLKWVNWKFLYQQYSTPTVADQPTLTKPALLKYWDFQTFVIIEPGQTDKNPLSAVEYDSIKREILTPVAETDIPSRVIVLNNNNLRFDPVPDDAYTIEADYYNKPTLLAANADVSLIPEEFHQVIIGRAMILYANFENAPEIKDQGEEIYLEQLALLENDQLPNLEHSRFNTGAMIEVIAE